MSLIQTILRKIDKTQYSLEIQKKLLIPNNTRHSLDFFIDKLEFHDAIQENNIKFSQYSYKLPQKKKHFTYQVENLKAHSASGDCVRLFCVYKELIQKF